MKNLICHQTWYRVYGRKLVLLVGFLPLFSGDVPNYLVDLVVFKFVKYAIRANQNIVKVVNTFVLMDDLWLTGHNSFRSS